MDNNHSKFHSFNMALQSNQSCSVEQIHWISTILNVISQIPSENEKEKWADSDDSRIGINHKQIWYAHSIMKGPQMTNNQKVKRHEHQQQQQNSTWTWTSTGLFILIFTLRLAFAFTLTLTIWLRLWSTVIIPYREFVCWSMRIW
jgi:hypothetical protein